MTTSRRPAASTDVRVVRVRGGAAGPAVPDRAVTEEPLEIRASGPGQDSAPVAVTMRTPGHDFELAAGFLFSEGLVDSPAEIAAVRYCEGEPQLYNVVTVDLRRPFVAPTRHFLANASCGLCGKAALDDIEVRASPVEAGPPIDPEIVAGLPERLRETQRVFDRTGGLHAAGLFTISGEPIVAREDVGRHNALDKAIGNRVLQGTVPLRATLLAVSGRVSFEVVQKAAVAGIPVVAAVSAPSSLAVDAAQRFGITLAGFVRDGGFNLYAGAERLYP